MYFPIASSKFKEDEYRFILKEQLKDIKVTIDSLVSWNKTFIDECNYSNIDKLEYDKDYLEFQRLTNKIIGIKE
jgi:enolase